MSTMLISAEGLGRIAYLTGASFDDLYVAHVANVFEFNREYAGRAPRSEGVFEQAAVMPNRSEMIAASETLSASCITQSFIEDTLGLLGLLRYNAEESLADEALTRIEAKGFYVYRCVANLGFQGYRQSRQAEEQEARLATVEYIGR